MLEEYLWDISTIEVSWDEKKSQEVLIDADPEIINTWVLVVSPKFITQDELSEKTYVGTVYSPYYGQVYAFREWLIDELFVDVWDTVTKWQKLGTLTQQTFSPELASMEAEKKSAITASQWAVDAASNTLALIKKQKQDYLSSLTSILWKNNELTQQKISQLESQQKQFLEWAKDSIASLDILPSSKDSLFWGQLDKEVDLIKLEVATQEQKLRNDIVRLDEEIALKKREITLKQESLEQDLLAETEKFWVDSEKTITSLRNAFDVANLIFYNWSFNRNNNQMWWHFWAQNTSQRRDFQTTFVQVYSLLQAWTSMSDAQLEQLSVLVKKMLQEAQTVLGNTSPWWIYSLDQLEIDINRILTVNLDDVSWVTTTNNDLEKQRIDLEASNLRIKQEIDTLSLSLDQLELAKSKLADEIISLQAGLNTEILEKENNTLRERSEFEQQKNEIERDKKQIAMGLVEKQQEFDQAVLDAKNDLLGLQSNNQTELIKEKQSYDLMIAQAQGDLRIAQAQLKASQQAYNLFVTWWYNNSITAPFNGTITKRFLTVGQTVSAETPIFDLVDSSKWEEKFVRFDVPEAEFDGLNIWQQIKFLRVQDPVRHYTATISRIANAIDEETKSILVEAQLQDDNEKILIGSTVVVMFEQSGDTSLVPITAVIEDETGDLIIRKVVDDIIVWQTVETGKTIGDQLYITSWLNAWDLIVSDATQVKWKETWDSISVVKWFQASEIDQWLDALGDGHDHEH